MIRSDFLSRQGRAHLETLLRRLGEKHGIARRANSIPLLDDGLSCEAVAKILSFDDEWHDPAEELEILP